jgi:hypothetical protein
MVYQVPTIRLGKGETAEQCAGDDLFPFRKGMPMRIVISLKVCISLPFFEKHHSLIIKTAIQLVFSSQLQRLTIDVSTPSKI